MKFLQKLKSVIFKPDDSKSNRYDNGYYIHSSSKEKAEEIMKKHINPDFKTRKPNVDVEKFQEAVINSMAEISGLSVERIDHTERLLSNVYGIDIDPKGIDSLFPNSPAFDLVDFVEHHRREKIIDKIMEDLNNEKN